MWRDPTRPRSVQFRAASGASQVTTWPRSTLLRIAKLHNDGSMAPVTCFSGLVPDPLREKGTRVDEISGIYPNLPDLKFYDT